MTGSDSVAELSDVQRNSPDLTASARRSGQDVAVNVSPAADDTGQSAGSFKGLRLLFAVDSRFPGLGGAESQALKLAMALRERGASVEFVTPRVLASQALEETFHGFTVKRVDYPHIRWVGSLFLMAWFARYLRANRNRFDAVHIHITHLLAASAGFCRPVTGLPITTKISGYYEFEGGVLDQRRRFMPLNFLIRRGLKHVDFVQTISAQTREKLLGAGFRNDQIKFVPNGIDTSKPPVLPIDNQLLSIGYCGRLREIKGVHVLLDAFAMVLEQNPEQPMRLCIAGTGETSAALLGQAKSLGISEHVQWLGLVEETAPFFQSLDIYVQPSFAEGLPNSVMEAMVEQRPVIASDIGGNNELVEHGISGLLFDAGDAAMLAEQIMRLIDEPDLRSSVARSGRQLIVDRFGFERITEQLLELYHG